MMVFLSFLNCKNILLLHHFAFLFCMSYFFVMTDISAMASKLSCEMLSVFPWFKRASSSSLESLEFPDEIKEIKSGLFSSFES